MIRISRITIYPIKALDPVDVSEARIVPGGALEHDRAFALFDEDNKLVNARRTDRVHRLRVEYDRDCRIATFRIGGDGPPRPFDLLAEREAIEAFLGEHFGHRVILKHRPSGGYPDDGVVATGPTIISGATLEVVASWYDGLSPADIHRRMRVNLVVGGAEAFWEDHLVSDLQHVVGFTIGDAELVGVSACGRCVVPTRDPITGEQIRDFQKTFMARREAAFLPTVKRTDRFNHLFRLTTRTNVATTSVGRTIRIGDVVAIKGPQPIAPR